MSPVGAKWAERLELRKPTGPFELGLGRIGQVVEGAGVKPPSPIITVAGTNGKGSTCRFLESILTEAGYRPGTFYSPHLLDFTERMRVNGSECTDEMFDAAFSEAERAEARHGGDKPLSYFEFITVAAAILFRNEGCGVSVLEVGLGGRLDAVNVFDADVAVVTTIGIDHVEHLGDDRESIGAEKAGVFRKGAAVVIGDRNPPASVLARAKHLGCDVAALGRGFSVRLGERGEWDFRGRGLRNALPRLAMHGRHQYDNAACALAALESVDYALPVNQAEVRAGLSLATLPGRFEVLAGDPPVVLDVAHNVAAAKVLSSALLDMGYFKRTHAIFGTRQRKDAAGMVAELANRVDSWHVAPVGDEPASSAERARDAALAAGCEAHVHKSVAEAARAAHATANAGVQERMVVLGSFLTVEEYMDSTAELRKAA